MRRPLLLDLFCGAGGAGMGYWSAGFDVVGVDIAQQDAYPFEFHLGDALTWPLDGFDVVHASPPCQRYCAPSQYNRNRETYPDLVAPIRERLTTHAAQTGTPWIIENTPGAPLANPITLCGTMFGLRVYRHRLFESGERLTAPQHPKHVARCARNGVVPPPNGFFTVTGGKHSRAWVCAAAAAMRVDWMGTVREVSEAIPPAYTLHVGKQLLNAIQERAA